MDGLKLNLDDITLGDIEAFEEYTGQSIGALDRAARGEDVPARVLTGMAYLALRQANPEATWDDAKAIRVATLMAVSADPTPAEPEPLRPLGEDKPTRRAKRTSA